MPDLFGVNSGIREFINAGLGICVAFYTLWTAYLMRGGALSRVAFLFALGLLVLMSQDFFVSFSSYADLETRRAIASYFVSLGLLIFAAALHAAYVAINPKRSNVNKK